MNATNNQVLENWHVYLLLCGDGSLYCGICKNPTQRLAAHAKGTASHYTRSRGAIAMRLIFQNLSKSQALKLEYQIKQKNRAEKWQLWQESQIEYRLPEAN